jgi:hypothetical protein
MSDYSQAFAKAALPYDIPYTPQPPVLSARAVEDLCRLAPSYAARREAVAELGRVLAESPALAELVRVEMRLQRERLAFSQTHRVPHSQLWGHSPTMVSMCAAAGIDTDHARIGLVAPDSIGGLVARLLANLIATNLLFVDAENLTALLHHHDSVIGFDFSRGA